MEKGRRLLIGAVVSLLVAAVFLGYFLSLPSPLPLPRQHQYQLRIWMAAGTGVEGKYWLTNINIDDDIFISYDLDPDTEVLEVHYGVKLEAKTPEDPIEKLVIKVFAIEFEEDDIKLTIYSASPTSRVTKAGKEIGEITGIDKTIDLTHGEYEEVFNEEVLWMWTNTEPKEKYGL